jgi:hypothetical protein
MDFNLLGNYITLKTDLADLKTANNTLTRELVFQEARINEMEKRLIDLEHGLEEYMSRREQLFTLDVQSSDEPTEDDIGATHEEHEVVQFADGIDDDQDGSKAILDPIHRGLDVSYELNNFFSRPTRIRSYSIP